MQEQFCKISRGMLLKRRDSTKYCEIINFIIRNRSNMHSLLKNNMMLKVENSLFIGAQKHNIVPFSVPYSNISNEWNNKQWTIQQTNNSLDAFPWHHVSNIILFFFNHFKCFLKFLLKCFQKWTQPAVTSSLTMLWIKPNKIWTNFHGISK